MTRGGRPTNSFPGPPHTPASACHSPEATSARNEGKGKGPAGCLSAFTAAGRCLPWSPATSLPLPLFGSFSGAQAGRVWGRFSLSHLCRVVFMTPMLWEASSEALGAGSPSADGGDPVGSSLAPAAPRAPLTLGWPGCGPDPLKVAAGWQAGSALGLRRGS